MRVHYRIVRNPEGEIRRRVLLLNAPLSSMFNWRLLIPELLSNDCLIAQIDLPGYGQSDCGRGVPQDADTRAQLVWGVLDEIDAITGDTSQYWHLISHGSACLTTMTMAHQAPECVASNVFISPLLEAPIGKFYRSFFGKTSWTWLPTAGITTAYSTAAACRNSCSSGLAAACRIMCWIPCAVLWFAPACARS